MGEFTDKLKGAANQVAGDAKQSSTDPNVRAEAISRPNESFSKMK